MSGQAQNESLEFAADSPDVVAYRRQRELGAILATTDVTIFGRYRTGRAIGTAQTVHADDEKAGHVEGPPIAAQERTPPIAHVGTSSQGVAYHHGVVPFRRELAPGRVCHGDIVEGYARLKGKRGDDGDVLVRDQGHEWVFRL